MTRSASSPGPTDCSTTTRLTGPDRDDALKLLTVTQLADLVMTVGFYQLVCNFLNTFEVTTEGETFTRSNEVFVIEPHVIKLRICGTVFQ